MYTVTTLKQRPDLEEQFRRLDKTEWPQFMLQGSIPALYREAFFELFSDFQIAVYNSDDKVIAIGSSISINWDYSSEQLPLGWDDVLEKSVHDHNQYKPPTTLVGMSITVSSAYRGQELGRTVLQKMGEIAQEWGFKSIIIPVRPVLKCRYPLTPIHRYAQWKREDNSPFDPWLRVHYQLGARQVGIATESMVINGSVAEWESWTGMCFPESGSYIVPEALQPVAINREQDWGCYKDPNIWVYYDLCSA